MFFLCTFIFPDMLLLQLLAINWSRLFLRVGFIPSIDYLVPCNKFGASFSLQYIVDPSCISRVTTVLPLCYQHDIVSLSYISRVSIWYNNARFVLPPYLHRVSIGSDRVAIGSHRTSIVHPSALCADYSLRRGHREKLRTIFKIDLSCCHRV